MKSLYCALATSALLGCTPQAWAATADAGAPPSRAEAPGKGNSEIWVNLGLIPTVGKVAGAVVIQFKFREN